MQETLPSTSKLAISYHSNIKTSFLVPLLSILISQLGFEQTVVWLKSNMFLKRAHCMWFCQYKFIRKSIAYLQLLFPNQYWIETYRQTFVKVKQSI